MSEHFFEVSQDFEQDFEHFESDLASVFEQHFDLASPFEEHLAL